METAVNIHILFYVGLLTLTSLLVGRLANYLHAPRLIGYLLVGILFGPHLLGLFSASLIDQKLGLITDIALAIIAFSIGGSLRYENLRKMEGTVLIVTITQAVGAGLVVTFAMAVLLLFTSGLSLADATYWTHYFSVALVIGAVSVATAPAAILSLVREYRAKGPLTSVTLGIVALDDALAILFYTVSIAIVEAMVAQQAVFSLNLFVRPFLEILFAVAIGLTVGLIRHQLVRLFPQREAIFGVITGLIFLTAGLAITLHVSPLLATMALGFVVGNYLEHHDEIFSALDTVDEPVFAMFFALAGAHLDIHAISIAGAWALLITVTRFAGKIGGTYMGCQMSQAPRVVSKYLGLTLLPTAGVTVGLILAASQVLPPSTLTDLMVSAVIGSTIINEFTAPFLVRFALFRSGEAHA